MYETNDKPERTLIISANIKGHNREQALEYLDELEFLIKTAGAEVVQKIYQELPKLNKATCVGSGKVEEIKEIIKEDDISLIVFDDDLTPMQNKNLVKELNTKVLDRSGIILDIFASRAKTQEAKTQVELAHMQYMLPRLTRLWTHLSKQFGGIGSRGPGETQIETDRRLLRERIQILKHKLDEIAVQQFQQRKSREAFPRFALVGYTNAGKSTLMKTLTGANVYVEDKLFATLDTTVRVFELPGGEKALLSDTVGFIRKLPANLVASFRSTLAEAKEADFLVHVVDVSQKRFREQIAVVNDTLQSLKIENKPTILVFNKIDNLEESADIAIIQNEYPDAIFIGAKQGLNINLLLDTFKKFNDHQSSYVQMFVPYSEMQIIGKIYGKAEILERNDHDDGIFLRLKIQKDIFGIFQNHYSKYFIQ